LSASARCVPGGIVRASSRASTAVAFQIRLSGEASCFTASHRRFEFAIEPTPGVGVHGVGGNLRLTEVAAFGAAQGPVLESGTRRRNALNLHARLAFETPRPFRRARRQDRCLWIGHDASVHWREHYRTLCHRKRPRTGGDGNSLHPSRAETAVNIAHY
jgi:hypothetical protein